MPNATLLYDIFLDVLDCNTEGLMQLVFHSMKFI